MEINEQALLAVLGEHLEVTEKLLEHSIKLTQMVEQQADSLIFEQHPTLEELRRFHSCAAQTSSCHS
jgi:hypothetical protein